MGQIPQDGENGKNVWHFFIFLNLYCEQKIWFFSTFLKFCQLHSKNVIVLIIAHLESELELFEVDDIGDDGDDDL